MILHDSHADEKYIFLLNCNRPNPAGPNFFFLLLALDIFLEKK